MQDNNSAFTNDAQLASPQLLRHRQVGFKLCRYMDLCFLIEPCSSLSPSNPACHRIAQLTSWLSACTDWAMPRKSTGACMHKNKQTRHETPHTGRCRAKSSRTISAEIVQSCSVQKGQEKAGVLCASRAAADMHEGACLCIVFVLARPFETCRSAPA